MRLLITLAFLVACCAHSAVAQSTGLDETPKVEVFVGYSASGVVNTDKAANINNQNAASLFSNRAGGTKGFEASATRNVNKYFGIKSDFSAYFKNNEGRGTFVSCAANVCATSVQDFRVTSRAFEFLAGPELKARNRTRLTPFAHALFGIAHARAEFKTASPTFNLSDTDARTGFAMAFGGGLDIRATKRFSVRSSIDYNPTFLGDAITPSRNRQDNVRLSLGVLFH